MMNMKTSKEAMAKGKKMTKSLPRAKIPKGKKLVDGKRIGKIIRYNVD